MLKMTLVNYTEDRVYDFSGNGTCWKMVYRLKTKNRTLKNCVYITAKGRTGYCITGTATPETFAFYEPIFDKIARSFHVTQ